MKRKNKEQNKHAEPTIKVAKTVDGHYVCRVIVPKGFTSKQFYRWQLRNVNQLNAAKDKAKILNQKNQQS